MNRNNICTHCGLPKRPPTHIADTLYVMQQFAKALAATTADEPRYVNGRRMGVPPIPSFLPEKGLKVNPASQTRQRPTEERPILVGGRRMGVPPIPSFLPVPPKEAA